MKGKQCKRILGYMVLKGEIDQRAALNQFGVARLASRIHDLKNAGYKINKRWIHGKNMFNEPVKWMAYSLDKSGE